MRSWILAAALACGSAPGCDLSELAGPAPGPCGESGAQCQLPDGPLGVCERSTCGGDEAPPCFACTPQH
jgi:hypothetical protein